MGMPRSGQRMTTSPATTKLERNAAPQDEQLDETRRRFRSALTMVVEGEPKEQHDERGQKSHIGSA